MARVLHLQVADFLRHEDRDAYTPKQVHIGPLHPSGPSYYRMEQPKDIEIQKLRYLKEVCDRTKKNQNDLAGIIQSDELKIRHFYSENFHQIDSEAFVKMILLDATFIIEFILRSRNPKDYEGDHIISKPCLVDHIWHDLILLENPLPYFVLKKLYNFVLDAQEDDQQAGQAPPFLKLACNFLLHNEDAVPEAEGKKVKHLTDLLRTYYNLPHRNKKFSADQKTEQYYEVCSAKKLDKIGVKFKAVDPDKSGLLDIKFKKKKYLDWCPFLTFHGYWLAYLA